MNLSGRLFIDEDNDKGEFELETETDVVNISQLLDGVYSSRLKPQVYIRVEKNGSLLMEEDGGIFLNIDEQKVESYFVCGINLSKLLWDNTGEYLDITIQERKNKVHGKIL